MSSGKSGTVSGLDGHTRLYWEATGTGDPVLLVHGLGLSGGAWWRTVDALAPTMRVITFDHRGIGLSESWTYAYTTEAMADDAVSILDELAIDGFTCTDSRSEAWSPSRSPFATRSGFGRSSWAQRIPVDAGRRRPSPT